MNKAKQMQKKLVKLAAIIGGVIVVSIVGMVLTGSMADSAAQRKAAAENSRNNDSSQISNMRNQIDQSGDAEKRFVDISLKHTSNDYSANTDTLKDWLRDTKNQYRFSDNFKLSLAADKRSEKPEFANLNFDVTVREPMKLEFGAISDMHVFSFLRQLEQDMPGMVRITKFDVERRNDMTAASLREVASGAGSEYVSSSIEFRWIGVAPKKEDKKVAPVDTPPAGGV